MPRIRPVSVRTGCVQHLNHMYSHGHLFWFLWLYNKAPHIFVMQNDHHFIRVRGSVGHLFGKGKQGNLSLLCGLRDIDWKVGRSAAGAGIPEGAQARWVWHQC